MNVCALHGKKYFVLLAAGGNWSADGESEEVRFINDGIVHFPSRELVRSALTLAAEKKNPSSAPSE